MSYKLLYTKVYIYIYIYNVSEYLSNINENIVLLLPNYKFCFL